MSDIKFVTDINVEVTLSHAEFIEVVKDTIDFAVNDKEYDIQSLSADFIAEDITGIMGNHGLTRDTLCIIDGILKDIVGGSKII